MFTKIWTKKMVRQKEKKNTKNRNCSRVVYSDMEQLLTKKDKTHRKMQRKHKKI